ncbi:MAG: hypothetical protein ABIX37_08565 [Gammaproteobacteria bacterium]
MTREPFPLPLPAWTRALIPGHGNGITTNIGGEPLWFASPDIDLEPSTESLICLLAPWCAVEHRIMELGSTPVAQDFLNNVTAATRLMGSWWGHDPLQTDRIEPVESPLPHRHGKTALFFSGGIDSFHTLVTQPGIDLLVCIAGFDVRLDNGATWQAMLRSYRGIATEVGIPFVSLATNVRDHAILGRMRWARYHVAVLASVAHLLRPFASRWLLSSTQHPSALIPWGSHPDLDHLWSGGGVEIVEAGSDLWRSEKLGLIGAANIVHRNLRVCYANPQVEGNCGQCEKCLRTRLSYWQELPGVECTSVLSSLSIVEALNEIPALENRLIISNYRHFLEKAPANDPVTDALRALLARTATH